MLKGLIGFGANLGDPFLQCKEALSLIQKIPQTRLLKTSRFYRSEPLVLDSSKEVPWYINGVALIETSLPPLQLLDELMAIEKKGGRTRRNKWESRLIDLDLLFIEGVQITSERLTLPHPAIQERAFVLIPLKDVWPEWIHPTLKKTVQELLDSLDAKLKVELFQDR